MSILIDTYGRAYINLVIPQLYRLFAFTLSNILVRLYHQGIHIKESELLEVSIIVTFYLFIYLTTY